MKKFGTVLTIFLLLALVISGCNGQETGEETTGEGDTGVSEPELTDAEAWAQEYGFGPYQFEDEDWDAILAAAIEEGSVVVYSNSSKIEKLIEPWNEMYPEIELLGGDTDDIDVKMAAEQESGNVVGDIWFQSSGHILYGEFMPNQWLWSYVPPGVEFVWTVDEDQPFALQRRSVDIIGYNSEIYPDGCPLTNWWELTEPELQGLFYMEDPLSDSSTTAKLTLIIQYGDEFAEAYQSFYGKDWTTDEAYDASMDNAGWLYIKKLAMNQPGIQPGGDEVDAAFATLGMDPSSEPGYGWTGLSSYEDALDGATAMAPCYTIEPRAGILKASYLGVATNAPHPNAAKLFIKFALSEQGFDPWSKMGTYPPVVGIPIPDGMPALDDIALWPSDDAFAYIWMSQVRDFWAVSYLAP